MKITRRLEVPTDVIEDIFCNKCGLSCKSPAGDFYGLIEAEVTAGYHSTHLPDGDVHKFSLCERCLFEMIESFTYSSLQGNYIHPDPENQAEGFDPKRYFPDGTYLPGDPEFDLLVQAMENDFSPEELVLDIEPEDFVNDVDDEDMELISMLPRPARIKKEDMN